MFVLPAMMLKGVHWGYTRYFYNRYWKPLDYTEDDVIRRFHPDDAILEPKPKLNAANTVKEGDRILLCPMYPALKLMGLSKKKPPGHPPTPKELLDKLDHRVVA